MVELPLWVVIVGGVFAFIGVITTVCLCPSLLQALGDIVD